MLILVVVHGGRMWVAVHYICSITITLICCRRHQVLIFHCLFDYFFSFSLFLFAVAGENAFYSLGVCFLVCSKFFVVVSVFLLSTIVFVAVGHVVSIVRRKKWYDVTYYELRVHSTLRRILFLTVGKIAT